MSQCIIEEQLLDYWAKTLDILVLGGVCWYHLFKYSANVYLATSYNQQTPRKQG